MKRMTMGAVLLGGVLSAACGGDTAEATGQAAQAATVCTCQWAFDQDGVLLAFPAPAGCALALDAAGAPGPLAACTEDMGDYYRPPPGYDRPPSHVP